MNARKKNISLNILLSLVVLMLSLTVSSCRSANQVTPADRAAALRGIFGTYDNEPRKADRHVDTDRLVAEIVKVKAQTYNFLIHHTSNDWDDLKIFLPTARKQNIKVWVTLVPPSEPPASQPFGLDFQRWGIELAKLSLLETNLVAWSIDDFSYDAKVFTKEYIVKMVGDSRAINPRLAFVPCLYYGQMQKAGLVEKYRPVVDGILFPYRHEMIKANLSDWDTLEKEIRFFKTTFGSSVPVIVDVYATKHSRLNDSTPEYVRQVMMISRKSADGVLIFCHQYEDKNPEKYHVIKKLFDQWSVQSDARKH
jgi:hypothetical protein